MPVPGSLSQRFWCTRSKMGESETTFVIGPLRESDKGDPGLILGETGVEGKKSYRTECNDKVRQD